MKGIILAGGLGTRLYPLTKVTNKHLLPVGKEPMIYHLVKHLILADIKSILVVTSTQHMGDIVNLLGCGDEFGCDFTYKVQKEAGGIAHALALAEDFASGDNIMVLLGDNIFEYSLKQYKENFLKQGNGARVLLKEVGDPERYGVVALDEYHVIDIEEKPTNPKSNFAVVGAYFFDNKVFDIIRDMKPSARGELEITSVNKAYIELGELQSDILKGRWTDAGTFESMMDAHKILLSNNNEILL
jgi:glucose-1-phosphate thymidylyltransferase